MNDSSIVRSSFNLPLLFLFLSLYQLIFCVPATSGFLTQVRPNAQTTATTLAMTTAYSGKPSDGTLGTSNLSYLPINTTLSSSPSSPSSPSLSVSVSTFSKSDWSTGMELMNAVIREGTSWPFEEEFQTIDDYRGYFLSHAAFVVKATDNGIDNSGVAFQTGDVLGCFYIKPNFPGRCSHVCNGGFITAPRFRSMGVGKLMGRSFLRIAKDLGYRSSYFNLVFQSNTPSVKLWEGLGFQRVAVLEKAGRLKGLDYLDTAYGYRYDLDNLPPDGANE